MEDSGLGNLYIGTPFFLVKPEISPQPGWFPPSDLLREPILNTHLLLWIRWSSAKVQLFPTPPAMPRGDNQYLPFWHENDTPEMMYFNHRDMPTFWKGPREEYLMNKFSSPFTKWHFRTFQNIPCHSHMRRDSLPVLVRYFDFYASPQAECFVLHD